LHGRDYLSHRAAQDRVGVDRFTDNAKQKYAITGLDSSDPRLTTDALHGSAEHDGWLIKGEAKLAEIREIVDAIKLGLSGGLPA